MDLAIETKSLTKKYVGFEAVKSIDLNIPKGKIYGLLGRNGTAELEVIRVVIEPVESKNRLALHVEERVALERHLYVCTGINDVLVKDCHRSR